MIIIVASNLMILILLMSMNLIKRIIQLIFTLKVSKAVSGYAQVREKKRKLPSSIRRKNALKNINASLLMKKVQ